MANTTLKVIIAGDASGYLAACSEVATASDSAAEQSSGAMEGAGSKIGGIFQKLGETLGGWGVPMSGSLTNLGEKFDEADTKGSSLFESLGVLAPVAGIAVAAAIAGAVVGSIDLALKFNDAASQIAAAAGISQDAAKKIGDAFLTTAGSTTFSATEMESAYAGVAAQLDETEGHTLNAAEALKVMKAASDLAEASGTSLKSATSDLAAVMQAFGVKVSGASNASDILYNTAKLGGASIDTVTKAFQKLAGSGVLPQTSQGLQEAGGFIADLTEHSVSGKAAMTLLTSAFTGIMAPTAAVTKAQQEQGLSFVDSQGKLDSFGQIIGELQPKIAGMGNAQATAYLKSVGFGNASQKLVSTIQAGPAAFDAATASVSKMGSAHLAAERSTDNFTGSMKKLGAGLEDVGTETGEKILPVIDRFMAKLSQAVNWVSAHWSQISDVMGKVFGVIRANMSIAINVIVDIFKTEFNVIMDIVKIFADLFTGKWGALWNAVEDLFKTVWDGITKILGAILGGIEDVFKVFGVNLTGFLSTLWGSISGAISSAWDAIAGVFSAVLDAIAGTFTTIWGGISTALSAVWSVISGTVSTEINAIATVISSVTGAIATAWSAVWGGIQSVVSTVWGVIQSAINGGMLVVSGIGSILSGVGAAWSAVWGGIQSAVQTVWSIIKPIFDAISSGISSISSGISSISGAAKSVSGFVSDLNPFAIGGIVTGPTRALVGEAGPEAIIPLSNAPRAAAIMQEAGLLPAAGTASSGGGGLTYAPNNLFTIQAPTGNSSDIVTAVQQALEQHDRNLYRTLSSMGVT